MLKRITPLPFAALLVLAACGGDDDDATTDATTATPPAPPTAPSAPATTEATAATTPDTDAPSPVDTATAVTVEVTAAPTTEPVSTEPAEPAAPTPVEPIRVALPGTTAVTNEAALQAVTALQEFSGFSADPAADLARFGLSSAPHVLVENGALFELTGGLDATNPERPEFNLDLSYVVQSDSPDPEALLAALQDAIAPLGEYEASTSTRTQDDLTAYFIDLQPADYSAGLPSWDLWALDLGASDPAWSGIVELHIETYGAANGFALPEGLAELDAQARGESPFELAPFEYRVDNSINMFGAFPSTSASISYRVADATDFATAHPTLTEALTGYGEPYLDEEGEFASWQSDPYSWQLNLNYEDKLVAKFTESRNG